MSKEPERPVIKLPIRGYLDVPIGEITINPDGTFTGRLGSDPFWDVVLKAADKGFVDGVSLEPIVTPAKRRRNRSAKKRDV